MFLPFKKILERRIRQYRFWPEILNFKVCKLWQKQVAEIFSPRIAKETKPLYFQKGVLFCKVKNPVISQELRFREEELKKRINNQLKQPILKRIVYKIS